MKQIHCEIVGIKIDVPECKDYVKNGFPECEECQGRSDNESSESKAKDDKQPYFLEKESPLPLKKEEQPVPSTSKELPHKSESLRKRCPPLPEHCPIRRKYDTDDAMYIINWGADFKNITDDISDLAYATCLSWWGQPLYGSVYNSLLPISNEEESELYHIKADFLDEHFNLGADELIDATRPLFLSMEHYFTDYGSYVEFLDCFACEINEYWALTMLWQVIQNWYGPRRRKESRLEDKLRNRLIIEVHELIKKSFGSIAQQRNYSELAAFILAKCGILATQCDYKKKRCNKSDCIKQRFKELPQHENIKPKECLKIFNAHDISYSRETSKPLKERLELCKACPHRKEACPAYFPCPSGKEAYKKVLQRKKYKGYSVEEFLEICSKHYQSEECNEHDSCDVLLYLEELRDWQYEMNSYVSDERYDPIQD